MKPIAIIQHVSLDGPEYFLDYLNRQAIPSCIFKVYAGDALPEDVTAYAGIATFGGPMSVNDESEHGWILPEIDFLRRAVAADVPVIQLAVSSDTRPSSGGGVVWRALVLACFSVA